MQPTGTPRARTVLAQHAEPAQVGDVEHHDQVGAADLLHRLPGLLHSRQVLEQEHEPRRRGRRIGDHDVDAARLQQVSQTRLAAEAVAVGIDVSREADALSRMERGGEGARGLDAVGRKRERHAGEDNDGGQANRRTTLSSRTKRGIVPGQARSLASLGMTGGAGSCSPVYPAACCTLECRFP